jgi:hypothetical protein
LLRLEGLTYQRIRSITNKVFLPGPKDLAQSWNNLRNALNTHTPYSFDVYENLEAYFMREGQPTLANQVYIEGRRRERLHSSFAAKAWNFFLDWTVGHGRDPARAFIISIVPLLLGALIFKRKNMQALQDGPQPYHPLWFSLDLMLPVVGLWLKDKWEPKPGKRSVWIYACVHKFLGWVLIPTGLAAFAGIVK